MRSRPRVSRPFDAGDVGGRFVEETPGNVGDPGGRWEDHELPIDDPISVVLRGAATELYASGFLGARAYGQGGREGPAADEEDATPPPLDDDGETLPP